MNNNKMVKHTENFLKRLIEKIKWLFKKQSKTPQNLVILENENLEPKSKSENKINIPKKIDGSRDFSVIAELIKKYESNKIKENELSQEEINVLEEYYTQKNIELVKELEYHINKIEILKRKITDKSKKCSKLL